MNAGENPALPPQATATATSTEEEVSTTEKIKQVKDQVKLKTEELEHQAEIVKARAEQVNDQVLAFIQERPAVSVGVAFVSGYLIGKLALRRWLA